MKLRGLYAITPENADGTKVLEQVYEALDGGISALQYRNKEASFFLQLGQARAFAALCRTRGVPFIVNDNIDIAIASGADGVHLGRDDGDLAVARSKLKGKILGVSCYDSLAAARSAVAAGADCLAVISDLFDAPDVAERARSYGKLWPHEITQ